MASPAGRGRLPRRCRWPLLLGAAPAAMARSPPFCSTVSTGSRRRGRRGAARSCPCCTRTSAAPATTIEERQPMLTHPTLDQLHQLGLAGMARAFEELQANPRGGELAPAEWLGLLLDREIAERQDRRLKARLRFAKLRHQASVEDIDWRSARGLDRALFQKLVQ